MLVTQQKTLRRFWYPVLPCAHLTEGPRPFTLLGEAIVLWKDSSGQVSALADRCCHRTAKLSKGWVEGDAIVCGYHGWAYDCGGKCVRIPQEPDAPPRGQVTAYRAKVRYGYVWVCLGEPLADIPPIPEAGDPSYRQIDEFYEAWQCAGLRVLENSFDNSHFSFVHKASFGRYEDPTPSSLEIIPFDGGFQMNTVVPVRNPEIQKTVLKMDSDETVRTMHSTWWLPFCRRLRISYPTGLVHTIITCATPMDDSSSMIVQFAYRNDKEEESAAADIIAFDRIVTNEDRNILESTDFDVPVDMSRKTELHMPSDKPGMLMRRMLLDLFQLHGEEEATRLPEEGR